MSTLLMLQLYEGVSHKSRRGEYSPTLYHYDVKYLVHDNASASSVKIIHSAKTVRPAFG